MLLSMLKIRPKKIGVEASSICQLRCPSCPNTSGATHPVIGRGFLRISDFRKLIDENPWVTEIELSNYGEIFLNPDLSELIEYAFIRGVTVSADNGVNLNDVKEKVLEDLVRYQFRSMSCSIDGASNETYKIYRRGGSFDTVLSNIDRLNFFKTKFKSRLPVLRWQFIVFGHNEHEIAIARKLAGKLNMTFHVKLSWSPQFSPVKNEELVRNEIGAASREEYKKIHHVDYKQSLCHKLWVQPQINWDGKVLGCPRNFWADYGGNAFKDGLLSCITGRRIEYAREMLLGKKNAIPDIPCSTCDIYTDMERRKSWLMRRSAVSPFHVLDGIRCVLRALYQHQRAERIRNQLHSDRQYF